jgi:hypothetical protein
VKLLVVDGAAEIFEELIVQVELQWHTPPQVDGGHAALSYLCRCHILIF